MVGLPIVFETSGVAELSRNRKFAGWMAKTEGLERLILDMIWLLLSHEVRLSEQGTSPATSTF
jgi:hypothetical protein